MSGFPVVPIPLLTTVGAPTGGAWNTGQLVQDAYGNSYYCVAGGTPGTWVINQAGAEIASAELSADPIAATTVQADVAGLSVTFNAPNRSFVLELTVPGSTLAAAADDLVFFITDSANTIVCQALAVGGNASFPTNNPGTILTSRLPRVGGANAYAITAGTSYTFKARQQTGAGTANIVTNAGQYRPILRAVCC